MENTVFGVRLCPRLGQSARWPCRGAKAPRDPATEARPSLSDREALPAMSKCQQMLRATAWELVVTGDGKSQGPRLVWVCSCVCVGNRAVRDKTPAIFCLTTSSSHPGLSSRQRPPKGAVFTSTPVLVVVEAPPHLPVDVFDKQDAPNRELAGERHCG